MSGLEVVAVAANAATIIDFICRTIQSLKEHITSPDIAKDLRILEETMWGIPDLMLVAESRHTKASGVKNFVPRLRELAYAAEDLVDELSYNELHQQALEQASPSIVIGEKRKRTFELRSFLPKGWASTSKEPPSIMVVTPERIQNLIEELNRVIRGLKEAFNVADKLPPSVSPTTTTEIASHRVTTSTTDLKRVRGREEEKQQMMEFLTPDPLIHDQKVFFFAITGIGGVGKTTLAKYAFNNLEDLFDLKVWICVSNAFDRKRFLQEIIEEITGASCNIKSINTLEKTIKREVKGKTLLLVLDDVWSTEWMDLLPPQQFSEAKCCKVIVTTREVNNIQTHDYESKMLPLVGLQGEEYRMLFEEQAFGDEDPTKHPVLRCIGEKIARKLKGNPLAAKTVGAVLRENLEIQHWNRVFKDDLWNLGDKNPKDIMPALMLSYLHLPPHLRRCFSYCALFLQDYEFNVKRLVWMWIAQGYVVCTNPNERLEDVGFKYFRELVSRSFFAKHPNKLGYSMHDLLHELATFVSLDECFMYRKESSMSNEKALLCHHLSVNHSLSDPVRLPPDLHHIRTLIHSDQYSELLLPEVRLDSLKSVRVMDRIGIQLSDDLGRLIHLRYLNLTFIVNLDMHEPLLKSICSLYHLQTLLLPDYPGVEYPNGINNLINLHHLEGNWKSIARIPSIGKLVNLQELKIFKVGKGSLHNIGQLKEMNQLHVLTISNICEVEEVDDAKNANMEMKKYLRSLTLKWSHVRRTIEHYDNVLEYLKPHKSLEELLIMFHKGSRPPSWLATQSLKCLKKISLYHCNNWRRIPHLAQLPHLNRLHMSGMDLVVDLTDQGVSFPSLENLYLYSTSVEFEGISKEEGPPSYQNFPKLREMHLDSYKNLESLKTINGLSNLTELDIHDSEFTSFNAEVMDSLKTLETLELYFCSCLKSLPDPPSTLKNLTIRGYYDKELEAGLESIRLTSNAQIFIMDNARVNSFFV